MANVTSLWCYFTFSSWMLATAQSIGMWLFSSMRGMTIIKKRFPTLVMVEATISFIALAIVLPISTVPKHIIGFQLPSWLSQLFENIAIQSVIVIETARLWLMAFDLHCLRYSKNQEWKKLIDATLAADNWYFSNKHRFGNVKNVAMLCAIYVVVTSVVQTVIRVEGFLYLGIIARNLIATAIFLICPGITVFIWCKIRKYGSLKDEFFFFFELKMAALLWMLSLCSPVAFVLLDWDLAATSCVIPYSFFFAIMSPSLLSTVVIPLKIKQKKKKNDAAEEVNNVIDLEDCYAHSVRDMMKNEDLFEALVAWMMREFSGECPLMLVEFVQFKQYVLKVKEDRSTVAAAQTDTTSVVAAQTDTATDTAATEEKEEVKYIDYCYDGVPISSIVSRPRPGMDEMEKCRNMAHELWLKYIKVGSLFEINISYGLRGKYKNCDDNNWEMSLDELLIIFDEAMIESHKMMRPSLGRWKVDMHKKKSR